MAATEKTLVLLICLKLMAYSAMSQVEFALHSCSRIGNYSTNSTFKTNLQTLISSISGSNTQLLQFGFYNSSSGQQPDKAYAIALCRGDVSGEICRSCVEDSTTKIFEVCPNQKEAIVWYNQCLFRYSNNSIFGVMNNSDTQSIFNGNSAADTSGFLRALRALFERLRNEASLGNSTLKFAAGKNSVGNNTVYALLQCTPDLSSEDCNGCLGKLVALVSEARVGARLFTASCTLRYETAQFFNSPPTPDASDTTPPPPLLGSPPPLQEKRGNRPRTVVIIIVSVLICIIALVIGVCIFWRIRTRRRKLQSDIPESQAFREDSDEIDSAETIQFDFDTIKSATNDFSIDNKLGQGGFGAVYKGTLANGQEIAVKRLSRDSRQGDVEFKNEVLLVAKLQHRNLVRLLGFCFKENERLLIYEFVTNGSLDQFIFDFGKRSFLSWERRYKIIVGVARGLLYLHEDSRLRIIHRDLKVSNILLDSEMNPKISDFGMARLFKLDETHGSTNKIVGTFGYMAPEYAMHGQFSTKSDVYSFGVLVLEIVSGQKNNSFNSGENVEDLLSFAWKHWKAGTSVNVIDTTLSSGSRIEMMRCIHIGLLCVQENVTDRPSMASVVLMLNSYSHTIPLPSQPAFFIHTSVDESCRLTTSSDPSSSQNTSVLQSSLNEVSISDITPR